MTRGSEVTDSGWPLYRPLSSEALHMILDGAYRVLEERGVCVYSPNALDALRKAGAEVVDETCTAKLPRGFVEDAIDSNPSSVTLYSRDGRNDAVLGGRNVHFGTGGTAIYVIDPDTGERRQSRIEDLILNARLIERLDNIRLTTINVFPNEISEQDDIDVNRFFHSLDNMTKHVMGGVYSLEGCRKVVRMAEMIAGSPEALREKPFVSFISLIVSPLRIDRHHGDIVCYLAGERLPVIVPTMPISGLTSPVTLAGNILMNVAETLAGITLIQSVSRGAPGISGSVGTIMNPRSMLHVGGAIERAMIQAAAAQIIQYLGLPLYSTSGTTDSKALDVQAAYESAMSNLLVSMSGAHYLHDAAGLIESELTVSYEKLVVDDEILGMSRRVLRGIEVSEETLALDSILSKGPSDHFAMDEYTALRMLDEFYLPTLANRDRREMMTAGDDAAARAHRLVEDVRKQPAESFLDGTLRREILATFPEIHFPDRG
jgi:trimethylamine--corrinoid protein Co-methyltransferase